MGIQFKVTNDKETFLNKNLNLNLNKIASDGLTKIKENTPVKSGVTKDSWSSSVTNKRNTSDIILENSNTTKNGIPVVALIVNGHGTKQGYYIPPNDFVTPVLEEMEKALDKEIERALDGI